MVEQVFRQVDVAFWPAHQVCCQCVPETVRGHSCFKPFEQLSLHGLDVVGVHGLSMIVVRKPVHVKQLIVRFESNLRGLSPNSSNVRLKVFINRYGVFALGFLPVGLDTDKVVVPVNILIAQVEQRVQSNAAVEKQFKHRQPKPGGVIWLHFLVSRSSTTKSLSQSRAHLFVCRGMIFLGRLGGITEIFSNGLIVVWVSVPCSSAWPHTVRI